VRNVQRNENETSVPQSCSSILNRRLMNNLTIRTPSRLHFGLLDMNGEIGRIDGGVGLALDAPHTLMALAKANTVVASYESDPEVLERLHTAAETVCRHYGLPGVKIDILGRPLAHVGLGSATQTLVGAALSICRLYGLDVPAAEVANMVGRGGTSGIGIAAAEVGGFIVDGGHRFRRGENSKHHYTPSSASVYSTPPPILLRHDFPDWDVLIVVPLGEGASGLREVTLFRVVCPIPLAEVQEMCHLVLMKMVPSIMESDIEAFGEAMEAYQQLGFKMFEFRAQPELIADCIDMLKDHGGKGVGMSSWGPALFAFGEDLTGLKRIAEQWLVNHGGGEVVLTKANNSGLTVVTET
jgi:beta-ribofuranosylaminobenzene 5'-phosphate synthase